MSATFDARVRRVQAQTADIKLFELVRDDGQALPPFTPGAHIDVHLPGELVRQYSLCNGPQDSAAYCVAVKRETGSRGGSSAMHALAEGDRLRVGTPRNHFELRPGARRYVLVAGGIGITPLLSMARHLLQQRQEFELHYFSRDIASTAFHSELSAPAFGGRVEFHYALEATAVRQKLRKILWTRDEQAHLYLCGPRPFMDAVQEVAAATWPPEAVHLEYFTADAQALAAPCDSFSVRLARSGGDYVVPADQSVVAALAQYGVYVDVSCEQGVCGTCLTGVIEGRPDHRDSYLTEAERAGCDKMLPCVSRSLSPLLVLDL